MPFLSPENILTQVETYNMSGLAYLGNQSCFIHIANKEFQNFQNKMANLGSTVTYDSPSRFRAASGLVWVDQELEQIVYTLTCGQAQNISFAVQDPQMIFNVDKPGWNYLTKFNKDCVKELAAEIEADVALNCISNMQATDRFGNPTGLPDVTSGPYRFYGDGVTPLSSYQQLAQMMADFREYGSPNSGADIVLPNKIIPSIIGTGLNQFVPERNNKDAMSWMLGDFGSPVDSYYRSNLLPIHYSGTVGATAQTLTVVSVNDPTGNAVTQITCSGATDSDPLAILAGDLVTFNQVGYNFLTYIGHKPCGAPVQFRVTASAGASSGGIVVLTILPTLNWAGGGNQNLQSPIVAGMTLTVMPSHKAGVVIGDDAFFLAMPRLPPQTPFPSASMVDDETGVSMRTSYGALLGGGVIRYGVDQIYGASMTPPYSMRILVPLSQA